MRAKKLFPLLLGAAAALFFSEFAAADSLKLISVGLNNTEPTALVQGPRISGDGRYVVFFSSASNLVTGDTNGVGDLFLYEVASQSLSRLSLGPAGAELDGMSARPAISTTGRYVAFGSEAANLVSGDTNLSFDCFLMDREQGTTTRVSVSSSGAEADGGSCQNTAPAVSADGRYVAFESDATNLVTGDTNDSTDIFVRDLMAGTTTRVSVSSQGVQADGASDQLDMSSDGSLIAFVTQATNLFSGDANAAYDVAGHKRPTGETFLVSRTAAGVPGNSASSKIRVSSDGKFISFSSGASDLVANDSNDSGDAFVFDVASSTVSLLSGTPAGQPGDSSSAAPALSSDGTYAAFSTGASNLIPSDADSNYDCYLTNVAAKTFVRASKKEDGTGLSGDCYNPDVSGDGHLMVFEHSAPFSEGISISRMNPTYVYLALIDLCPEDSGKDRPGVCGCGVSDADSDGDGVSDCNESCAADPNKTQPGVCGCGISDADGNGNGNADCLDPTALTVPTKPVVSYRKGKLTVTMQSFTGANVRYQITAVRGMGAGRVTRRRAGTKNTAVLPRFPSGLWKVTYTVKAGSVTSKPSPAKKIRVP